MAIATYTPILDGIRGTIGQIYFSRCLSRNTGKGIMKQSLTKRNNPQTEKQQEVRRSLIYWSKKWSTLTIDEKQAWEIYASSTSGEYMRGVDAFIGVCTLREKCNYQLTTTPPRKGTPNPVIDNTNASWDAGTQSIKVTWTCPFGFRGRVQVIIKSRQVKVFRQSGAIVVPGMLQTLVSNATPEGSKQMPIAKLPGHYDIWIRKINRDAKIFGTEYLGKVKVP